MHPMDEKLAKKLSRTDFLIYLKELNREASLIVKQHGSYFQYALAKNMHFPNHGRSQSF
jgi:hypothetical protein